MTRFAWVLVVGCLAGCQTPEHPDEQEPPAVDGSWRYLSSDRDKGEDLDLHTNGRYSRTKWVADVVHEESGHYQVQASKYEAGGLVLFFYPAPDTVTGSVWHRNPYGYRVTQLGDTALGLMVSSRVNPASSESVIGETIQTYHRSGL